MSNRILIAFAACAVLSVAPAVAQDGHEGHDHGHEGHGHDMDPAMMQKMMELMTPGPAHQEMDYMAGTWKTMVKNGMTGEETEGTYTFEWTLGKRAMIGRYSGTMMGQPFEGMSIDGFDNQSGTYYSLWMDTMSTGYTVFTGESKGEGTIEYTATAKDPMGGGDVHYRSVAKRAGDKTFTYTMYMTQGDDEMMLMEMTGTKM